jgi:regulatory protein
MKKENSEKILLEKIKTYLAYRAHSEHELKRKLTKSFSNLEIEKAIQVARKNKWIAEPEELAHQLAEELHKKNKGWLLIQAALKKKQLPSVQKQEEREEEKCLWWVKKKFGKIQHLSQEETGKIYRFLSYRGFEESLIKKVVYEYKKSQEENT